MADLLTRYLRSSAAAVAPALMRELCDAFAVAVKRRRGIVAYDISIPSRLAAAQTSLSFIPFANSLQFQPRPRTCPIFVAGEPQERAQVDEVRS